MSHWWQITGVVEVEENVTTCDALGRPLSLRRVLTGIAVQALVWSDEHESFVVSGEARTDRDGRFRFRTECPPAQSRVRLSVALAGAALVVSDEAPSSWIVAHELTPRIGGSLLDVGVITFREGAEGEIGERDHVRRALTWYVARAAMDYLGGLCPGLSFTDPITIRYPAVSRTGGSYACRASRTAIVHRDATRDDWSVERVLRQVMRLWSGQCAGARFFRPDSTASGDERFADLATNELLAALWGRPIPAVR